MTLNDLDWPAFNVTDDVWMLLKSDSSMYRYVGRVGSKDSELRDVTVVTWLARTEPNW